MSALILKHMRRYKTIFLCVSIVTVFLCLYSCTSSSNKPQETSEQSQQKESTGEIVNKYVDTLTTARDKAKKAAGAENRRVEEQNKAAQEMGKE